jgi:hypothetical protein
MAEGSLPFAPSDDSVSRMLEALSNERDAVGAIIKAEVEELLHWGAEIAEMTCFDASANTRRACPPPKNMRTSFLQDDGLLNLKRIRWTFHELPDTLHKDVLMHRMSHMDVVTIKVMLQLNAVWGVKREGEETKRSNCIEKMHAQMLNEKKTTIVKPEKNRNRRMPFARKPQTRAKSGNPTTHRQGMTEFYWKSMAEGEKVVITRHGVISCWACCASLTGCFHSVRLFLVLRLVLDWRTCSVHFSSASVQATLEKWVWLHIPCGFGAKRNGKTILMLNKSIHGLSVAPKLWCKHLFKAMLKEDGFVVIKLDPCPMSRGQASSFLVACEARRH